MANELNCRICASEVRSKFQAKVLERHLVNYFECNNCGYIQTEKPYWLDEAYSSAIASMDVGLVFRNMLFAKQAEKLIKSKFNSRGVFLDFAGGYGLFVRIMRDRGFNFFREDKHCENLFAHNLDRADLPKNTHFELITAFEVFEHLVDPILEVARLFEATDSILFSTTLIPGNIKTVSDWWYFVPETGQHIGFFTLKSLEVMAKKFDCNIFSNGIDLHLLTKKSMRSPFSNLEIRNKSFFWRVFRKVKNKFFYKKPELESLISFDFEEAKKKVLGGDRN